MKSINFPEANEVLAKDQPEYQQLHVYIEMNDVIVPNKPTDPQLAIMTKTIPWSMTACFELTDEEIAEIVKTKKIWHTQMVFGNRFQPIRMSTQNPFVNPEKDN